MSGPHVILGVEAVATPDEIKAAFRKKVLECHPDVGGDGSSFAAVMDAYERLTSVPETREEMAARLLVS